ncbi:hypothetical protein V6N11_078895 [Hibiscus sabdariffa]|uniref:FRIGIDA-like protein n=1 Tax=Hibiscus sabdariffa TaxID=183260 RepID=A0ABR2RTU0_9ROSI
MTWLWRSLELPPLLEIAIFLHWYLAFCLKSTAELSSPLQISCGNGCLENMDFSSPSVDSDSGFQDLQQPANVAFEVHPGTNEPPLSPGDNRENSSSSTSTKSRKRDRERGESSTSRKRSEPGRKPYAELIKGKSVGGSAKILKDQIARKIASDKIADMGSIIFVVKLLMDSNSCNILPQVLGCLDQIKTQCPVDIPVRPNILRIKQNIEKIEVDFKNGCFTKAKAKEELIKMEKEIKELNQLRAERSGELNDRVKMLENIFVNNMDFSVEILRTELASFIQWTLVDSHNPQPQHSLLDQQQHSLKSHEKNPGNLTKEKLKIKRKKYGDKASMAAQFAAEATVRRVPPIETNLAVLEAQLKISQQEIEKLQDDNRALENKNQELMKKIENVQAQLSLCPFTATDVRFTVEQDKVGEDLLSKFSDLKNQLYDENNNQVENHDFPGLEEALDKTTGRKVPDRFELIATRIAKDRGKATGSAHFSVLVLVCAAVEEMEKLVEVSDWGMLKKWAAALNQAGELDFSVGFAKKLLNTKLLAYFATTELLKGIRQDLDLES